MKIFSDLLLRLYFWLIVSLLHQKSTLDQIISFIQLIHHFHLTNPTLSSSFILTCRDELCQQHSYYPYLDTIFDWQTCQKMLHSNNLHIICNHLQHNFNEASISFYPHSYYYIKALSMYYVFKDKELLCTSLSTFN